MLGGHIYQTWAKDAKDCNEFYTPNIDEHILNNYKNKLDSYFKKDVLYLLKSALFMCVSIYVITKTLTYIFEFVVVPAINFAAVVSTSYIFVSFMSIYLIHLSNKKSLGAIAPYARKIVCKKIVKKKYYIEWVDPLVYENDELSDRESKVTRHEYNDLDVNDSILIFNKGKKLFIFKNN